MKGSGNSNLTNGNFASPERTPPDVIRRTDCSATGLTVIAAVRKWFVFLSVKLYVMAQPKKREVWSIAFGNSLLSLQR